MEIQREIDFCFCSLPDRSFCLDFRAWRSSISALEISFGNTNPICNFLIFSHLTLINSVCTTPEPFGTGRRAFSKTLNISSIFAIIISGLGSMKQITYTFPKLLRMLSAQSGEEKLRIAFGLSALVRKVREEGKRYEKVRRRSSARRSS